MVKQYVITRLINNNVVFSTDASGNEIILFGKAIGFQKKKGDKVSEAEIVKIFEASDAKQKNYLTNLVESIQSVYIDLAAQIIGLFEERMQVKVNDMMYISLSDHISNAVANKKEGFELRLDILEEIKQIYLEEFLIARKGLDLIEEQTGVRLREDEAGFIVLHYVNSRGKEFRSDAKFQILFQDKIIRDIEEYFQITLNRSSLHYTRFLTHLNFMAARIHDKEMLVDSQSQIYQMLLERYPHLKGCIDKNAKTIHDEFQVEITEDEKSYLAIHILNMLKSLRKGDR